MARVGSQAIGSRPLLSRRQPVVPVAHMCIHGTGVNAVHTRVLVVLRPGAARRSVEAETDREPIEPRRRRSLLALSAPPAGGPAATTRSAAAASAREGFPLRHCLVSALTCRRLRLVSLLLLSDQHLLPSREKRIVRYSCLTWSLPGNPFNKIRYRLCCIYYFQ
jgi:hypothetical protein